MRENWTKTTRYDKDGASIADRHYTRRKIGSPQFVRPGSCLVLITKEKNALWVTSITKFPWHQFPGAWECSLFRNESSVLSSDLILEAISLTKQHYGEPPKFGMITFVRADKIRKKRDPGRCFIKAGFKLVGKSSKGYLIFQLSPEDMPN